MSVKRNLVLCGMKHCGKTTHGRRLAEIRSAAFADTDELLEREYRGRFGTAASCREIYLVRGEEFFRKMEASVIAAYASSLEGRQTPQVTALGGGAPVNRFMSGDVLRRLGFCIYLEIDVDTAFRRVEAGGLPPYLAAEEDPRRRFAALYRERAVFYRGCADLILHIDGDEPEETVTARLVAALGDR